MSDEKNEPNELELRAAAAPRMQYEEGMLVYAHGTETSLRMRLTPNQVARPAADWAPCLDDHGTIGILARQAGWQPDVSVIVKLLERPLDDRPTSAA